MSETGQTASTVSVILGVVLVILGIGAYILTEFASVTALIPALFGVLIVILGLAGRQKQREQMALYGVGALGVIGILGSLRAVPDIIAYLTGDSVDSVVATLSQGIMIVVCLLLVVVVISYILDRR